MRAAPIKLYGSSANRLADVRTFGSSDAIVLDATSSWNQLERFAVVEFNTSGVTCLGANNVLADMTVAHGRVAIDFYGSDASPSNVLLDATTALDSSYGVRVSRALSSTVMNLAAFDVSIGLETDQDTHVHNVAAANTFQNGTTGGTGIRLAQGGSPSYTGYVIVGNNEYDCQRGFNLDPKSCQDFAVMPDPASGWLIEGVTLVDAFVAQTYPPTSPPADDKNLHGETGTVLRTDITDFLRFENRYRGWGRDGTVPSYGAMGVCRTTPVVDTCGIYDWSAYRNDGILLGLLAAPVEGDYEAASHTWTVADADECAAVPEASWSGSACQSRFLLNSVELTRDGVGNDNLLCEATERCLFTPNIGAYQGHGELVEWDEANGTPAESIMLFQFSENGNTRP